MSALQRHHEFPRRDTRRRPSVRHPVLRLPQPNGSPPHPRGQSSNSVARARPALACHGCSDPEGRIRAANLRDARSRCPAAATTERITSAFKRPVVEQRGACAPRAHVPRLFRSRGPKDESAQLTSEPDEESSRLTFQLNLGGDRSRRAVLIGPGEQCS